jgi:hypothetical protein
MRAEGLEEANRMARYLLTSVSLTLLLSAPQLARASCVGTPLTGLDPTGLTDNTALIQTAIDQNAAAGGGAVVLNPGRYLMTGTVVVKRRVIVCGAAHGPFDVGVNPATTTVAPTFLITNTSAPFITLAGDEAAILDILFHYPNQVDPSAPTPIVYPFTIYVPFGGTRIERCTVTNAYRFLDIEAGRVTARSLNIGAFFVGIQVDHALDHVTISDIIHSVFWDIALPYPQPIDTWVLNHGSAFVIKRVDGVTIDNVLIFHRHTAFHLTDSSDVVQFRRMGYGSVTNIDVDTCMYAVRAHSTETKGFKFSNIDIGCGTPSTPAVWGVAQEAFGTSPPKVMIIGGSIGGVWAGGLFQKFTGGGKLVAVHIFGYDE